MGQDACEAAGKCMRSRVPEKWRRSRDFLGKRSSKEVSETLTNLVKGNGTEFAAA